MMNPLLVFLLGLLAGTLWGHHIKSAIQMARGVAA